MNYNYILLDVIITVFAYMIVPFCIFFRRSQNYTIKFKKIFLIANSIVIAFGFVLLRYILNPDENAVYSFAPAMLYYCINYGIWVKNNLDDVNEETNSNKKYLTYKLNFEFLNINKVFIIVITILTIIIIIESVFIIKKQNYADELKKEIESLEETIQSDNEAYFDLLKENIHLTSKSNFMDEYIVFVLDGYGNYYYSYDCMKEVTEGKKYAFWVYSINSAVAKGYKPFNCSN